MGLPALGPTANHCPTTCTLYHHETTRENTWVKPSFYVKNVVTPPTTIKIVLQNSATKLTTARLHRSPHPPSNCIQLCHCTTKLHTPITTKLNNVDKTSATILTILTKLLLQITFSCVQPTTALLHNIICSRRGHWTPTTSQGKGQILPNKFVFQNPKEACVDELEGAVFND